MSGLHVVIGASGYIGSNLVAALAGENVIQVSRRPLEGDRDYSIDLACAELTARHPLFDLTPATVWYLARPVEANYEQYRVFHSNMQRLLLAWSASPALARIHFASTTLVYDGESVVDDSAVKRDAAPHGVYEYFKLETELFLQYLCRAGRSDVAVRVWRLPLVLGGRFDPARHGQQFIYWFVSQYQDGYRWQFERPADYHYGTSWVYLPDLIHAWTSTRDGVASRGGFQIRHACSGFFTYAELDRMFGQFLSNLGVRPFKLYRSRFEVRDDGMLPARDIAAILRHELQRVDARTSGVVESVAEEK